MKFSNRRSRQNAEISMLNLIDVIFMLLIFFMIATTFNKSYENQDISRFLYSDLTAFVGKSSLLLFS